MDIDYFKNVNDKYGHTVGDSVLIDLTKLVSNNLNSTDTFGRWGGEEFVILHQNTTLNETKMQVDKIRKMIYSKDDNLNKPQDIFKKIKTEKVFLPQVDIEKNKVVLVEIPVKDLVNRKSL